MFHIANNNSLVAETTADVCEADGGSHTFADMIFDIVGMRSTSCLKVQRPFC